MRASRSRIPDAPWNTKAILAALVFVLSVGVVAGAGSGTVVTRHDVTTGAVNVTAPGTAAVNVQEVGSGAEGTLRAGDGSVRVGSLSPVDVWVLAGGQPALILSPGGDAHLAGTLQAGTVPWARLSGHPALTAGAGLQGGGSLAGPLEVALDASGISTCTGTTQKIVWDAANARLSCGTDKDTTYTPATGGGLALSGTEFRVGTGSVTGAMIQDGAVTDQDVATSASIQWSKISKTGSSLADLATRTAPDLTLSSASDVGTPLALVNTGSGGRRYNLMSTGTLNTPGAGHFALYDATTGQYRILVGPNGEITFNDDEIYADLDLVGGYTFTNNLLRMKNVRAASTQNTNDIAFTAMTTGGDTPIGGIIARFTDVNYPTRDGLLQFRTVADGSGPFTRFEIDGGTVRTYTHILPYADNIVDLGAFGLRFNEIWAGVSHFGDACGSNGWCFTEGPDERPGILLVNDTRALKFSVHEDGYTPALVDRLGECGPLNRGMHQFVLGSEGQDDQEYVCRLRAGAYTWDPIIGA